VARADTDISEEARRHFKAGVADLQDPEGERYEDAYREFKKAYELSHSPKILGNLALCAMKLERDGEAIDAYTRYLVEVADIDAAERAQITRDLQTLSASVLSVTLSVTAQTLTIVDTRLPVVGQPVTNFYDLPNGSTTLRLRPGHHVMKPRGVGAESATWEFTGEASAKLSHAFDLQASSTGSPQGAREGSSRLVPIIVTSVGVAALAVGGAIGLATLGKVRTLESECPQDTCSSQNAAHDLSTAHDYVRATDYTLLAGGVVAAGGILWYLLAHPRSPEAAPAAAAGTSASGGCFGTGCYATLRVGF
jgi:hypothetical protein